MTQARKKKDTLDLSAYKALYLREARSFLGALRQNLARLQDDPADHAALHQAHRAAHTLKGMSATMRYEALAALARSLEEPLKRADQTEPPLSLVASQIDALLAGCDEFEARLDQLPAAGESATSDT